MRTPMDEMDESGVTGRLLRLILRMPLSEQGKLLEELGKRFSFKKRKHHRKSYFSVVDYVVQDNRHTDFAQNISAGGVFIGTASSLSVGQAVELRFPFPLSRDYVSISGEIAWSSDDGIGVKFNPIDSQQEKMIESLVSVHP